MFNKRGKKAQIFIIAALIIIAIVIGLAGVTNYIYVKEKPEKLYDISSNIDLEGVNIIKYGLYENEDLNPLIENFTKTFADYISTNEESANSSLVIIYGNENNVTLLITNNTNQGSVTAQLGDIPITFSSATYAGILKSSNIDLDGNIITLKFSNNVTQTIALNPGQNFMFILTKDINFETYVTGSS